LVASSIKVLGAKGFLGGVAAAGYDRKIELRHPGAQHIKYRIHDLAIVSAGTHSALRHQRLEKSPFVIAQIKSHAPPPITVNHDPYDFSRSYVGTDPNELSPNLGDGRGQAAAV
jgi:hypothetical protein